MILSAQTEAIRQLIPAAETIPAPFWLFELLGVVTLLIHFILINIVVGGFLIFAYRLFRDQVPGEKAGHIKILPTFLALAINFGVAPLLFVQVNYGHLIYSSSILLAVYWISIIGVLIAAYYGVYAVRSDHLKNTLRKTITAFVALALLYIAFIFVNNMTLMVQPEKWIAYFNNNNGTILNLSDAALWPRYPHFICASIAVAGLFTALRQVWRKKRGHQIDEETRKSGMKIFAYASLIQVVIGLWFLFSLPAQIRVAFLGSNMMRTGIFALSFILALVTIFFALKDRLTHTIVSLVLTMLLMVKLRMLLRSSYLEPYFSPSSLEMKFQLSPTIAFFAVFAGGLAVLYWLMKIALKPSIDEASTEKTGGQS